MKYLYNKRNLKKPFFSIITVVKNDQKKIFKTLRSIKNQTFKNFEYIIIDGASTDKTLDILKKNKIYDVLISEKDNGIYDGMNKGLKICNGEVVLYVNSGDTLTKDALKMVNKEFKKNENFSFLFATVLRHYRTAKILKSGYNFKRIRYNFDFATSHSTGFFLKKTIYDLIGNYDTNFKCSADYDLYFRLFKKNYEGTFTKKSHLIGNVAAGGFSSKLSFLEHLIEETKIRVKNKQNFLLIIIIFVNAIIKNFIKKIKLYFY
jgi:glycosyltransferase involved in cell wall biosynthesis